MKLRKRIFSKNNHRSFEYGDVFSSTFSWMSLLSNLILAGLFTPAVIATSLLSKDIVLMITNLLLAAGYSSNMGYRIYSMEMSYAELLVSLLGMTAAVCLTLHWAPAIVVTNALGALNYANFIATGLNSFFLVKHIFVPPLKAAIELVAKFFGYEIGGDLFFRRPLTLEKDRHVLDLLLKKHYSHDSFDPAFNEQKIEPFNRTIEKLSSLINKYNDKFLGSYEYAEPIKDLEKCIDSLTLLGNSDSSFSFIKRRLSFKTTKLKLLNQAKLDIVTASVRSDTSSIQQSLRFFEDYKHQRLQSEPDKVVTDALSCLNEKITQEEDKVMSLELCLPQDGML